MIYLCVSPRTQTNEIEELVGTLSCLGFWDPIIARIHDEISSDIEVRIKIIFLRNDADHRADVASLCAHIETLNQQLTGGQRCATGNHAHRRGLAGSVRSQLAKGLSP